MSIICFLCLLFLVLIQGGYYPQTYIIVGIVSVVLLIVKGKYISFTIGHIALMILTVLYAVSAVVNGMAYSLISKAMLPLALFVVALLYTTLKKEQKDKLITYITVAGVLSGLAGIVIYFGMSDNEALVAGNSLMFTFQYANAAGCWYAVCFVLAAFSQNKYIRCSSVLCLSALLCTRSYGALIILGMMLLIHGIRSEWFMGKVHNINNIRRIICIGLIISCLVCISVMCYMGADSLLERVIHSYDGMRVLLSNVVCGIGPDNWQYVFPFYQSAYYSAGVIHNSYVQAGVDAGIMSMIILLALLALVINRYIRCKSVCNLAAVIIMVHSIMEYNLYFAGIDMLLIILVMKETVNEKNSLGLTNRTVVTIVGIILIGLFTFSLYGNSKVRMLESAAYAGNVNMAQKIYKDNELFMQNGYKESEIYGISALICKKEYTPCKMSARYRRYEMINSSNINLDAIIEYIEEQKNFRNVRIEARKLIEKMDLTEEENNYYYEYVNSIDDSVDGWFARMVNK